MDENIEKLITKIVEAKLEQIVKKIDILQVTVDRAIAQLDDDRKDISDIKVAIGKNLAVTEGARDDIDAQTKRVVEEVKDNLQPIPDVVSDSLTAAVAGIKKKKWFQLFLKRSSKS